MVATPFLLVLAEKALPFTLIVTFLPATALPPDFKVILTFLVFLTLNLALGALSVTAFLDTVLVTVLVTSVGVKVIAFADAANLSVAAKLIATSLPDSPVIMKTPF